MNYAQMNFKALEHLIEIKFPLIIALMLHLVGVSCKFRRPLCVSFTPSS